ncbi:MAG: phosphatidylserine decarboxylase family protein [Bacteroidetes bacterium]|nr:phosphatidylserine decarboxylase family protein [Bacteroidota bacterium]
MRIHKEGYFIISAAFAVFAAVNLVLFLFFSPPLWVGIAVPVASVVKFAFLLYFFRLPDLRITPLDGTVISPADGRIVIVERVTGKEHLNEPCLQISVFMSPLNMHSNRYPVSGTVKEVIYHPGKYLVAWHPKSSELNERSTIVLETNSGTTVVVRQIAGFLARRIVTYARPQQKITQGDELGFIKFGSRVDIFLPVDFIPMVEVGQSVRANNTVLGSL